MNINDFLYVMKKVLRFKKKLDKEGIAQQDQDIILKIYVSELTEKIDINFLEMV